LPIRFSLRAAYFGHSSKKVKNLSCTFHQAVVQIQKLAFEVFEFVPLLDESAGNVFHFF
jgi:hypothetical protein